MKTISSMVLALLLMTTAIAQTETATKTEKTKPTAEERTEKYVLKMQQQIGLDDAQKQKVYDIRLEKVKKIKEIRTANAGDAEAMKTAAKPIVKEYNTELKAILNEGQLEKWKVFRKGEKDRMKANIEKRKAMKNEKAKEIPLEDDDYMDSVDEE